MQTPNDSLGCNPPTRVCVRLFIAVKDALNNSLMGDQSITLTIYINMVIVSSIQLQPRG